MTETIYIAPDIRKQKLEEAEAFINQKRVQRLAIAASYQRSVKEKAEKLHGKVSARFDKQMELFDNAMSRVAEQIDKLQERLEKMNEMHSEMTNLEGVIKEKA